MKFPHRRKFLHLAVGVAALPAVSQIAKAQSYPTRPVRWIVGFPPGGGADTVTRILGQWLSDRKSDRSMIGWAESTVSPSWSRIDPCR